MGGKNSIGTGPENVEIVEFDIRDIRDEKLAELLGLEEDGNHSELFVEAIDRIPTEVEVNGYEKTFSYYKPNAIQEVMKAVADEKEVSIEFPTSCDGWDEYREAINLAMSAIDEQTSDDIVTKFAGGREYTTYRGRDLGAEELSYMRDALENSE